MTKNNEDIYRVMGKPLVRKVLEGFNAVLIAYGQTGSGKTHTLVGKPEQGVKGVLPFMLEELLNTESVKTLSVSGCEAYGTHVSRIELFDLFNEVNNQPDWTKKKGSGGLEPKKCTSKPVTTQQQCWDAINEAHDASHFAPTGKNPESSRGHVAFCTKIEQEKGGSIITSYLIVVDLAGSEGESAFTPEFVKKVDPPTLMARRLEAGCINTGLSQLQVVFNELKVKGKLTKSKGTGLRRILHAYINQNCMISVMFTLSPAFTNRTTTESTLKFAVQAGMVKVKPVKAKAQVNFKALVADLQKHVKEQEELIEKLNDDIEKLNDEKHDLTFKVSRLEEKLEYAQSSGGGGGDNDGDNDGKKKGVKFSEEDEAKAKEVEDQRRALQKRGFKRTKTIMPDKLQSQLLLLNDVQDDDEDEDGYQLSLDDQKSCVANNISAAKVDSDIQRIHNRRKTAAIDTNLLNAAIRRSTTMSNLSLTVDKLGALPDGNEEKETNPKNKVETPTPATYDIDDDNPDNIPAFADTERQQTIKQTMIGASNIFDVAQNEAGDEEDEDPDFMTFETKDTANMTQDELVDYCDQLESKLIEEKTLRYGLQKSQQVIIDHLMETNEALLQWFKIKKIL